MHIGGPMFNEAYISCGSTRAFAHGKVGLCPRGVHVLCVTYKNTVKVPTGNHQGYIKENKRITHDTPGAKLYGLSMVYLTTREFNQSGGRKLQIPETAAHAALNSRQIPCHVPNSRHAATSMANFRGSQ